MPEQLPQLRDENPVMNVQERKAPTGYDAFAKVLGGIAETAEQKAGELLEEQSNALALQQQNSISDTITGAQINMINNPGHAAKIVDDSRDTIDTIVNNAFVNDKDRLKLQSVANSAMNQVELLGAKTAHEQSMMDTTIAFHNEVPKALMDIDRFYLSGDLESAKIRQDNLMKTAASALKMGAITISAYERVVEGIQGTVDNARLKMDMVSKGDANAVDYHRANNTPYGRINVDPASTPTDQYTTSQAAHYDSESSYQKLESDLYRYGHIVDINSFNTKLTPAQISTLHGKWVGTNDAQSMIQAGTDYLRIERDFKDLESKKTTGLTLAEEGKYNYLKNYFSRLGNGEYMNVMRELPQGARIAKERAMSDAAIDSSSLDDNVKILRKKENEDWERQQLINLGYAMHMNPKYIKVMDNEAMMPFKAAFVAGQNPDIALKNLQATDPTLHPYIADALDKQNQSASLLMISNAGKSMTVGFARDLIVANQEGFDKTLIDVDKDSKKMGKIIGAVANDKNVQMALNYMSLLPNDMKNGQSLPDGTITALANTVILQAKRNGDLGVDNLSTYVSNISEQVKKSFAMYQDQNMRVNNATLKLPEADLKSIGLYAKDIAYQRIKGEKSPVEFLDFFDRHPLVLTNTPNNVFVMVDSTTGDIALDKDGQPLFEWPFTETLRRAAIHHKSKYDEEAQAKISQFKESHPFGRTFQ